MVVTLNLYKYTMVLDNGPIKSILADKNHFLMIFVVTSS